MAVVSENHAVSCQKSHVKEMALTGRDTTLPLDLFFTRTTICCSKRETFEREALYNDVLGSYLLKATG